MNTISDADLSRWQHALQPKFPGVMLRRSEGLPDTGHPLIHAYCIPDELRHSFVEFMFDEIIEFVEKHNLPDVDFLPSSVSETIQHHPELAEPALAAK